MPTRPTPICFEETNMQIARSTPCTAADSPSTDLSIESPGRSTDPRRARASMRRLLALVVLLCSALASWVAIAQVPNVYGPPIGTDAAKRATALAIAEAKKNNWTVAVAVVDTGGVLVYFERIDGTQNGSSEVALAKARSAAAFKRPTKVFEEALAGGRTALVTLPGALPIEGGLPIVDGGKVVGAIGVSGVTSQQDGICAQAALAAFGAKPTPPKK
jgi:glc operon protein GlcG